MTIFAALAWFAAVVPAVPLERDVRSELERLAAPVAAERAAAQRWLEAHVTIEDRPLLGGALATGDAEVRGRIGEVLGNEDRLVLLAALFAADSSAEVASVGRAALRSSVLRWSPHALAPAAQRGELHEAMSAWVSPRIAVDELTSIAPLEDVLDLVAPVSPGLLGLAVAPGVGAQRANLPRAAFNGSFESVLLELAERHGARLAAFSSGDASVDPERWIAFVPQSDEAPPTAAGLLVEWAVRFAGLGDLAGRAGAARALAGSGWPAGVELLAQRWTRESDEAALEGLLLAARRGRVALVLRQAGQQAALRERVQALVPGDEEGARRALRIALALGATGTRGSAGEDLVAPALTGLATLTGAQLHLRLAELDAREPTGEEARQALDAVLAREDVPAGSRFLALRVRARFPEPLDSPARAGELVEFAARAGRLVELARSLSDARAHPPESWRDPAALPAGWDAAVRAYVAVAWLARGEMETAVAHVARAAGSEDAGVRATAAGALAELVREVEPVARDAFLARLLDAPGIERMRAQRFVAQCAGARSEAHAAFVLGGIADPAVSREDLVLLGALAASPRGTEARARLVAAVKPEADLDDLVAGLDRAILEIRAARDDGLERAFVSAVRPGNVRTSVRLRSRLMVGRWPSPAPGRIAELARSDLGFERFGL